MSSNASVVPSRRCHPDYVVRDLDSGAQVEMPDTDEEAQRRMKMFYGEHGQHPRPHLEILVKHDDWCDTTNCEYFDYFLRLFSLDVDGFH